MIRVALTCTPLLLVACGACTSAEAIRDAQPDAVADASILDGWSGKDAVAPDVDLGDANAGWRFLTEIPGCDVQIALDPKTVMPALQWRACPSNDPNCEQFDTTGWRNDMLPGIFQKPHVSKNAQWLAFTTLLSNQPARFQLDIYDRTTFEPISAFLSISGMTFCDVNIRFGISSIAILSEKQVQTPSYHYFIGGMPSGARMPGAFLKIQPEPKQFYAEFALSESTMAFDQQSIANVIRFPNSSTSYVSSSGIKAYYPLVVGDDVFAHNEYGATGWSREIRVNADGSTTIFRDAPGRHVSHFASDGKNLFWTEVFGDPKWSNFDQPYCEIWWAPYTNDPSTLVQTAKKLAQCDGVRGEDLTQVAFDGYYAVMDRAHFSVFVVRAPDGAVKKLDTKALFGNSQTGYAFMSEPAFVSKDELWGVMQSAVSGIAFVKFQLGSWP